MKISREDQIAFAEEMMILVEKSRDAEMLASLYNLAGLFRLWVGSDDSISFELGGYIYESLLIAKGQKDDGWRNDYREKLEKQFESIHLTDRED